MVTLRNLKFMWPATEVSLSYLQLLQSQLQVQLLRLACQKTINTVSLSGEN
jgi:hypothetical protein